ncbi:MAG: TIM barrel protein [Oscillospiraceae bacterium]|nr:TIM barrel protein [Oscillospiraceae bacterium]
MSEIKTRTSALFGSGGNPKSFYSDGHKDTIDVFKWLSEKNIDSYEYQAGNGLNAGTLTLKRIGEEAEKNNIVMSLHAPYFISISSDDDEIIVKSINHLIRCINGASALGAYIVVVHSGALGKNTREKAVGKAKSTIEKTLEILYKDNKTDIQIGLETMGKQNQLGTIEEVIELCKVDTAGNILRPVVDFGHLYAREVGENFKIYDDYLKVFEQIGESLSDDTAKYLHCHFSKIEYTQKGEKKHLTFADKTFGPEFEPLAEVLAKNKLCPNIICESDETMDIDALFMKNIYNKSKI